MDYQALKTELDAGHPDTDAEFDALAATEMNAVNRTRNRGSMLGDEIFAATDNAEFGALTDHHQEMWVAFTSKDIIDPFGQSNIDFLDHIFGGSSVTKTTLAGLRTTDVSRATEIGIEEPNASHVTHARTL